MADSKEGRDEGAMANAGGVLAINQMTYKLPPDASVTNARNMQSQMFMSQSYSPGATAVCILQSGSQFVDFTRSWLVLSVRNTSTAVNGTTPVGAWFGANGSACNLINRISIMTRSGATVETLHNANQYASHKLMCRRGLSHTGRPIPIATDASGGAGLAQIYGHYPILPTDASETWINGGSQALMRFCIPCSAFSPLLGNARSLWPSNLCSGMRIELLLENAAQSLITTTGTATDILNYSIEEIRLETECYSVSDLVLRTINAISASDGLEVVSETVWDTQNIRSASSVNVDCQKTVSRALGFVYKERPAQVTGDARVDFMASYPVDSTNYPVYFQARIGSLYMSQAGLKNVGGAAGWRTLPSEAFATTMQDHLSSENAMAVSFTQYMASAYQIRQSLERSSVVDLSGQPLANTRLLTLQAQWSTAPASANLIDLFLEYAILIKVFITGSNVEI